MQNNFFIIESQEDVFFYDHNKKYKRNIFCNIPKPQDIRNLIISPDGTLYAYQEKDNNLDTFIFIRDLNDKLVKKVKLTRQLLNGGLAFSPSSDAVAFVEYDCNIFRFYNLYYDKIIVVYNFKKNTKKTIIDSERYIHQLKWI